MRHFLIGTTVVLYSFCAGAKSEPAKKNSALSSHRSELIKELTGRDETRMSDLDVYSELVAAYQARDRAKIDRRLRQLLVRYPQSPFADNGLYLAGLAAVEDKRYADALKFFQRVQDEYPTGNKAVSAHFAKAMAYKMMNLDVQAKRTLQEVITKYPGSPESFRADNEMRLFR